jgi:hypothetical protein
MILPLIAVTERGEWRAIGTTFVLHASPRDALLGTAAHNVSHYLPRDRNHPTTPLEFRIPTPTTTHVDGESLGVLLAEDERFAIAPVVGAVLHKDWDIALLRAQLPQDAPAHFSVHISLDTSLMEVGARVAVAGYPGMKVVQERDGEFDAERAEFELPLKMRLASVLATDPENPREGPRAQISCAIDSGMSGGPVFEMRGSTPYVRAIARSDMTFDRESMMTGSGAIARVTMLWPMLGFPIPLEPTREGGRARRLADLIQEGILRDAGDGVRRFLGNDPNVTDERTAE